MITSRQIIDMFKMKPLTNEGGYYTETYRAEGKIQHKALPERYSGARNYSTAILCLLTADKCSKLHRVKSDEIFHFYLGDPVIMLQLFPDGSDKIIILGNDIEKNQQVQVVAPKDIWQGCFIKEGGSFALMGTTVSPGFEFDDFELARREYLLQKYPAQQEMIIRLTE